MSMVKSVELGDLCEIKKGSSITKKKITSGEYPVIAGGQQAAYYHNRFNRSGKTITVSASGAYAGYVNFFETPIFASDCSTIKSNDENSLSPKYIYYFLKAKQKDIYKLQRGAGQPHVYPHDLKKLKIPVIPLSEQKRIVEVLERVERLKDKRNNCHELARQLPQLFFNKYFEPIHGLHREKLNTICDLITQGPNPDLNKEPKSDLYGLIKTKDIYDNSIYYEKINALSKEEFDKYKKYELKDGDILLAIVGFGSIGKVNIFKECKRRIIPTRALAVIRPLNKKILPTYLKYYFQSALGKKLVENWIGGSTGQLVVKTSSIKNHLIPLPSATTQLAFAKNMEFIERLVGLQFESNKKINQVFDSLIQQMFSVGESV